MKKSCMEPTVTLRTVVISLIAMAGLLLGACAQAPTAQPSPEQEGGSPEGVGAPPAGESPAAAAPDGTGTDGASTGCEDRFDEVYAELAGLQGDERKSRLVELAQEEGQLSVYTSNGSVPDVAPSFASEYDIETQVYRAPSDQVGSRLQEEAAAGSVNSDIIDNTGFWMTVADENGLTSEYEGPLHDELPDIAVGESWVATQYLPHTVAWNTELLPEGEQPTSYEELAEPEWSGRITLDPRHYAMYMALQGHFLAEGWSEEDVNEMWRGIGENATLMEGNTQRINLMIAGEQAAGIGMYIQGIDVPAAEGAPIAWEPPVVPIFVEEFGSGLTRCAAHPAAALLYYEWIATDGQEVMASFDRVTTAEFVQGGRLEGLELLRIDYGQLVDEQQQWQGEFHDLIGYQ